MLPILFEDNHLLVVNKPAGLPTQGAAAGERSVVTEAKAYLKHKYQKPGNVYLGVVSRLDASVSGVLVLARTSKAAARLNEQFRSGTVEKRYVALVAASPQPPSGTLEHWLRKDDDQQRMLIVPPQSTGAQLARLSYELIEQTARLARVAVRLHTGRKHQIRVQLAAIGCPILGDRKYGSRASFSGGIALHAERLVLDHPTSKERLTFEAPLPASWQGLLR